MGTLGKDDYLVLEAHSGSELLHHVRSHSRPIQVLLLQNSFLDDAVPTLLKRLRPDMQVVMIANGGDQSGLSPALALAEARQILQPTRDRFAGRQFAMR